LFQVFFFTEFKIRINKKKEISFSKGYYAFLITKKNPPLLYIAKWSNFYFKKVERFFMFFIPMTAIIAIFVTAQISDI
jgi:hypothetical protein